MEDLIPWSLFLYILPAALAALPPMSLPAAQEGPGRTLTLEDQDRGMCIRPHLSGKPSRIPRTPGDNGFRIRVVGRPPPEGYRAGSVYTVEATFMGQGFRGFQLVAVPQYATDETTQLGHFQHLGLDPRTRRFSADCPHVVMSTGSWVKGRADVLWIAPPSGTGCVEFRATIFYGESGKWLQDDGALTKLFCEQGN